MKFNTELCHKTALLLNQHQCYDDEFMTANHRLSMITPYSTLLGYREIN